MILRGTLGRMQKLPPGSAALSELDVLLTGVDGHEAVGRGGPPGEALGVMVPTGVAVTATFAPPGLGMT